MMSISFCGVLTELNERIRTLVCVTKYRSAQANTMEKRVNCPGTWLPCTVVSCNRLTTVFTSQHDRVRT
jgi:hypothetical protein